MAAAPPFVLRYFNATFASKGLFQHAGDLI